MSSVWLVSDGVDDAETGGLQCTARLGEVHDHIDDVGNLCLRGPIAQPDVGVDPLVFEKPSGEFRILGRDPCPRRQIGDFLVGRSVGDGDHDAHWSRRRLRVVEKA